MSLPSPLLWELVKDFNSFKVKRRGHVFSTEKSNLARAHTPRYSGLCNLRNITLLKVGKGNKTEFETKNQKMANSPAAVRKFVIKHGSRNDNQTNFLTQVKQIRPDLVQIAGKRHIMLQRALHRKAVAPTKRPRHRPLTKKQKAKLEKKSKPVEKKLAKRFEGKTEKQIYLMRKHERKVRIAAAIRKRNKRIEKLKLKRKIAKAKAAGKEFKMPVKKVYPKKEKKPEEKKPEEEKKAGEKKVAGKRQAEAKPKKQPAKKKAKTAPKKDEKKKADKPAPKKEAKKAAPKKDEKKKADKPAPKKEAKKV